MGDSVHWTAIPDTVDAIAGYIDGALYPWPADAWSHFYGRPVCHVSVLADPAALAFDVESGNATAGQVAETVSLRTAQGKPSVVYTNGNGLAGVSGALASKSLRFLPAVAWPSPGPYLWAADPTIEPGTVPTWCPVTPVAVQDRWEHTYDLSTTFAGWLPPVLEAPVPTTPAPPAPAPAPVQEAPYLKAPTDKVRVPHGVTYVPTATFGDALDALDAGRSVYVWTGQTDIPVQLRDAAHLNQLEHAGDHAYTQYVTYLAEPVA